MSKLKNLIEKYIELGIPEQIDYDKLRLPIPKMGFAP